MFNKPLMDQARHRTKWAAWLLTFLGFVMVVPAWWHLVSVGYAFTSVASIVLLAVGGPILLIALFMHVLLLLRKDP